MNRPVRLFFLATIFCTVFVSLGAASALPAPQRTVKAQKAPKPKKAKKPKKNKYNGRRSTRS